MRRATVALVAFLCLPIAGAAQAPSFRQIVDLYRRSPNDGVERMLSLSENERIAGVDAATAGGAAAWTPEEIGAAAMMQTDAGFYFLSRKEPGVPHLLLAERLVAHVMLTSPGFSAFGRRWYFTVESIVRGSGDSTNADWFARHFKDRFKDNPQRAKALDAYHRGVFAEYDGCQKGEFLTITGLTESGGNLVQRYFVPAARDLDMALDLNPELLEAALHLGRVRMVEGKEPDAVKYFQMATSSKMRSVGYLAKLFLGAYAEKASRWEEAEKLYRESMTLFAAGQSAPIALAQLLDRRARSAEATQVLTALFARARGRTSEPWTLYFEEVGVENAARVAMLRMEVLKWRGRLLSACFARSARVRR